MEVIHEWTDDGIKHRVILSDFGTYEVVRQVGDCDVTAIGSHRYAAELARLANRVKELEK